MDLKKAFGYLRVSGKAQVEGDGFPRQRKAIETFAHQHGYKIVRWFQEEGVSGKTDLENRPALHALMEALASNGTKVVLIEKLDRLARDLMVQETIIAKLRTNEFALISVTEPDLCVDDPSRKLMRQIFGAFAEYDRVMIVSKLKAARQRKRLAQGWCEKGGPYGTRPEEKPVLEQIQGLATSGLNCSAIATELNAAGIKPRVATAKWHDCSVRNVLRRLAKSDS